MANNFAEQYRSTVGPRLREMCRVRGVLIALGQHTFGAALAEVMMEANRRGSCNLSTDLRHGLEEQVACWLLESSDEAARLYAEAAAMSRQVAAQYGAWEQRWLQ